MSICFHEMEKKVTANSNFNLANSFLNWLIIPSCNLWWCGICLSSKSSLSSIHRSQNSGQLTKRMAYGTSYQTISWMSNITYLIIRHHKANDILEERFQWKGRKRWLSIRPNIGRHLGLVVPLVLFARPVVKVLVMLLEMTSQIRSPSSHGIDVVVHLWWNLLISVLISIRLWARAIHKI